MRIAIAKEAFKRKMSLLKSKLNIVLEKKLVRCYVWSIALYDSETLTLRKVERKYLKSFEMWKSQLDRSYSEEKLSPS